MVKRIFFIIPTLSGGGAERVMANLLRNLNLKKIHPSLILFEKKDEFLTELPLIIPIFELKTGVYKYIFPWLIVLKLTKLLKEEKPDLILSFMWYPNAITLMARFLGKIKTKVIISERISTFIYEGYLINFLRSLVIRYVYPKANFIILNSNDIAKNLIDSYGITKKKISVIYNPIDINLIHKKANKSLKYHWYQKNEDIIIAIGRLCEQKGFSYLIKAISILTKKGTGCKLIILGEGKNRQKLHKLIIQLGIEDRVFLLGFQLNPYKYLARAKIFVLSSLYEGLPNVLLEALALGVPVIATRCPTGPEEIITNGINGLLVPPADETALAWAISKLLNDKELRQKFSEQGRKRAEDFRINKIIREYEKVIDKICAESAVR